MSDSKSVFKVPLLLSCNDVAVLADRGPYGPDLWLRLVDAAQEAVALLPKKGGYVVGYRAGPSPENRKPVWVPHTERVYATPDPARRWALKLNGCACQGLYTVQYDPDATVNQEE